MSKKSQQTRISTRVKGTIAEKLKQDAARREITINALVGKLITEYYGITDKCIAEVFRDDSFICVWGRKGRPPSILKLAEEVQEKTDICKACKRTLDLLQRVEKAEILLSQERIVKMPSCSGGAKLRQTNEGRLELECLHPDFGMYKWRDVENFCMKANRGLKCHALEHNPIIVKGQKIEDMK